MDEFYKEHFNQMQNTTMKLINAYDDLLKRELHEDPTVTLNTMNRVTKVRILMELQVKTLFKEIEQELNNESK